MISETLEKIAAVVGITAAICLVLIFVLGTQTEIPFFVDTMNAILGFLASVGTVVFVGILLRLY